MNRMSARMRHSLTSAVLLLALSVPAAAAGDDLRLVAAARARDRAMVRTLLKQKVPVNARQVLEAIRDIERRIQTAEQQSAESSQLPVLARPSAIPDAYADNVRLMYAADTPMTNLQLSLLDKMDVGIDQLGDSTGRLETLAGVYRVA